MPGSKEFSIMSRDHWTIDTCIYTFYQPNHVSLAEPREAKPVPKGSWSSPYWDASRMRTLEVGFRRPEVEMRGFLKGAPRWIMIWISMHPFASFKNKLVASCIIFRLCFCGQWQHEFSVIMICHCGENFFKFTFSISFFPKNRYFEHPIQLSGEVSNRFQSIVFRWDNPTIGGPHRFLFTGNRMISMTKTCPKPRASAGLGLGVWWADVDFTLW